MRRWSEAEDLFLLENYKSMSMREMTRALKRTREAVRARARLHGLTNPEKLTLCWDCAHAAGKDMCCWAARFEPVDGWIASPTVILQYTEAGLSATDSFLVLSCPKFCRDCIQR